MKGLGLLLVLTGCGQASAPPPPPAVETAAATPGAILAVDGLTLTAAELEPLMRDIALLYPEYTPLHLRRLALTNHFLPLLAARASAPEAWGQAKSACERAGEGGPQALEELPAWHGEGTFHGLGVALWSTVRHQAPGTWSGPIELPGRWVRVRVDEVVEARDPREELLRVAIASFPYLEGLEGLETSGERNPVESAIDRARLTVLDPQWSEAVPETWKHRMRGTKP